MANSLGVRWPSALWGRSRLYSSLQVSTIHLARARFTNQRWFKTLIPEPPVEAFDEGVLDWLARVDEPQLDAVLVRSLVEHPARELRAVVHQDRLREAAEH
jgi:hypothetical protein